MPPTRPLLRIDGVTQRFGGVVALDNVSLDVFPGEIVSLIGPNGAGKTSLFNVITGLYTPTSGRVLFGDEAAVDVTRLRPDQIATLGIARTFQNLRLFNSLTLLDNIKIGRHGRLYAQLGGALFRTGEQRKEEQEATDRARQLLQFVNLHEQAHLLASNLPYGDARRLEIARALAAEPKLLLLDEPVAGMNPFESRALMEFVRDIRARGVTILLIEHDMAVVMDVSDRIVVLDHGEKIAEGEPEAIQRDPRVIEAYLGTAVEEGA